VLVQVNANSVLYELHKATLLAGESLCYTEKTGFFKLCDTTRSERIMIMSATSVHATAGVFADITGLTCPVKANILYAYYACLHVTNNATTTGSRFGFNIGAAPTDAIISEIGVVTPSATSASLQSGSATAVDTSASGATITGHTTSALHILSGFIIPSAAGTFALRAASEVTVANGLVVGIGSFLRIFRPTG
jgi:hypothetical protein